MHGRTPKQEQEPAAAEITEVAPGVLRAQLVVEDYDIKIGPREIRARQPQHLGIVFRYVDLWKVTTQMGRRQTSKVDIVIDDEDLQR